MAATTLPICHLINEYDVYVDTIIIKNKKIDERGKICTLNTYTWSTYFPGLEIVRLSMNHQIKFYRTLFLGNIMSKTYTFLDIQE
jgi:hypothetical protein